MIAKSHKKSILYDRKIIFVCENQKAAQKAYIRGKRLNEKAHRIMWMFTKINITSCCHNTFFTKSHSFSFRLVLLDFETYFSCTFWN